MDSSDIASDQLKMLVTFKPFFASGMNSFTFDLQGKFDTNASHGQRQVHFLNIVDISGSMGDSMTELRKACLLVCESVYNSASIATFRQWNFDHELEEYNVTKDNFRDKCEKVIS